jgi:hypothetical protein
LSDAIGLENALALTPLTCIVAAASFVLAGKGYRTDIRQIDKSAAAPASQGAFA